MNVDHTPLFGRRSGAGSADAAFRRWVSVNRCLVECLRESGPLDLADFLRLCEDSADTERAMLEAIRGEADSGCFHWRSRTPASRD